MQCELVTESLPRLAEGNEFVSPEVRQHVETCLHCQGELVQYRKLLNSLHNLRTEVLEPAPGLLSDILARIESAGERRAIRSLVTGRRAAYAGGFAVAAAAGVAGIVFISRSRNRRMPLAS